MFHKNYRLLALMFKGNVNEFTILAYKYSVSEYSPCIFKIQAFPENNMNHQKLFGHS